MAGVVVLVAWSSLCPQPGRCDFSLIRGAAGYWRSRHRHIVLGVATVGLPAHGPGGLVETATPGWVLRQVATYTADVPVIGGPDPRDRAAVAFPSYADPRFARLVDDLLRQLAVFDGDPAIAQLRISTGLESEDNPSPGGAKWLLPGYTDREWIAFCLTMARLYRGHFHRTQLEFDLGVTALAWQRGDAGTRRNADALVGDLIAHDTFLAFDGLSSRTRADLAQAESSTQWLPRIMHDLRRSVAAGHPVGLEAMAPLTAAPMQDIDAIADTVAALPASRLVLFPFEAAALDAERHGDHPGDRAAMAWIARQTQAGTFPAHLHRLLARAGLGA